MSTPGSDRVDRPVDPVRPAFDALFEDPADSPPALDPSWREPAGVEVDGPAAEQAADDGPAEEPAADEVDPVEPAAAEPQAAEAAEAAAPDPRDDAAPLSPGPTVDTGRLFRSAGAEGPAATGAIPALAVDRLAAEQAVRGASDDAAAPDLDAAGPDAPDGSIAAAAGGGAVLAGTLGATSADAGGASTPDVPVIPGGAGSAGPPAIVDPRAAAFAAVVAPESVAPAAGTRGLTGTGVWVVVVGVTVLVGFADALLNRSAGLGWITGAALVASTLYAALTVRPADLWLAVIVPPLAFLAATLTAGQLTLPGGQGLLVREGLMIFTTLSNNAPWIIGATALALVIVLVRRGRARKAGLL